jgi:phenylpropionate dioxygenase-like ring-hydroxylating dioxygenase large terminal subunit
MPFSFGRFDGERLECSYHGWQFDMTGKCRHIPSLVEGSGIQTDKIEATTYPASEQDGYIWVYVQDPAGKNGPLPEVPKLPLFSGPYRSLHIAAMLTCTIDDGIVGLMDPAHGPFVHNAWWWRRETSIHAKEKHHVPSLRGFTMATHKPSSNSFAYKLLGGDLTTEIRFELPSLRFEHIRAGKREVLGFTAVTPKDENSTLVTQVFYWTTPWLGLIRPFFRPFARAFLGQDRRIVELQNEGLKFAPPQMLIQDADVPAIWYHRLKKAWAESVESGAPFVNPVQERTLRWRS